MCLPLCSEGGLNRQETEIGQMCCLRGEEKYIYLPCAYFCSLCHFVPTPVGNILAELGLKYWDFLFVNL